MSVDIERVAAYLATASSLGAWVFAYARKDLSAYKRLDSLRDDLSEQLSLLDRRLERLEASFRHSEELQGYRLREIAGQLNRHRAAINDQVRFLNQRFSFQPRVNGHESKSDDLPDSLA